MFVIRDREKNGKPYSAHIWDGKDTACGHWLTGGLPTHLAWTFTEDAGSHPICKTCLIRSKKTNKKTLTTKTKKKKAAKNKRNSRKPVHFLASQEWRALRYKVLLSHDRRCMCCGATPDDGITVIHVDHIKPRHKHPELSLNADNLQILCGVCNQGKGAWDETDFRHCVEDEDERLEREFQIELSDKATTYQ